MFGTILALVIVFRVLVLPVVVVGCGFLGLHTVVGGFEGVRARFLPLEASAQDDCWAGSICEVFLRRGWVASVD